MSKPIVAIVGRPNVGKSTLFNVLAGDNISIVKDTPGDVYKRQRSTSTNMRILAGSAASTRSEEALWRALWSQVRSFCRATVKSCI